MAERINKNEFVRRVAKRMEAEEHTAQEWVDAMLDTMYDTFRGGKGLTLPGFGGFYLAKKTWRLRLQIQSRPETASSARLEIHL